MSKSHEIVILGANMAGTGVAHYLLKHTIPALRALDSSTTYHITLVGPATKFYYKISVPRVVADPSKISWSDVTVSIADAFAPYPKDQFDFVQGLATALDVAAKTATVTAADGSTRELHYSTLVLATGTKSDSLWTVNDDLTSTTASLDALHAALPTATTAVVAGGGPVGVETAGELAAAFPSLKITLLSGSTRVLSNLSAKTSAKAESMLAAKGVTVVHGRKVKGPAATGVSATVEFDDGSKDTPDVYIHAVGGVPNSGFVPESWLDGRRRVNVDDTGRTESAGVYALGDVASNSDAAIVDFYFQWPAVVAAIGRDIAAGLGHTDPKGAPFKPKKFKKIKDTQFVPIGPSGGVGQAFGWGIPSFLVWFLKARTFFIEKAKPMGMGEDYAKA